MQQFGGRILVRPGLLRLRVMSRSAVVGFGRHPLLSPSLVTAAGPLLSNVLVSHPLFSARRPPLAARRLLGPRGHTLRPFVACSKLLVELLLHVLVVLVAAGREGGLMVRGVAAVGRQVGFDIALVAALAETWFYYEYKACFPQMDGLLLALFLHDFAVLTSFAQYSAII